MQITYEDMNCKDTSMLRVVRGNGFKLKIAVDAYTTGGRRVESFNIDEAELKLYKNGTLTTKAYTILEGTTILVKFDGTESLGVYGFQMEGTFEEEAWRWANWKVLQLVETTEKANIPEGCVLIDDTYNMAMKIVLSGGDGVTFTPSVSEQGIISWTNDGGLPNPEPRNIRGPQGERGPQGIQGPRGPVGLRGQIGPKGDKGNKGDKGDTGTTPIIDATASVDDNIGTPQVFVDVYGPAESRTFDFSFRNLKGERGETGATGAQGPQGAKGDTGATGPQGPQGPQGIQGLQGEQGPQGEPGNYTKPASGIPLSDLNGNVASGIVYDVTANNSGATFASLSALLSSGSLSTLIPTDVRKGGMQIRFVQSSDNKYVQYRYTSSSTAVADFTNVANWQGVDDEPTAGSKNLVTSGGVNAAIYSKIGSTTTLQLTWTTGKRVFLEATNPAKILNATNEYAISNYIDITNLANAVYEFSGLHGLTNVQSPSINFYDENKNHIGYLYEDGDYSLEKSNIPSGAKYILICQCTVSEYPTSSVSVTEIIPSTIILSTEQVVEGNKTQEEINAEVNADVDEIKDEIESLGGKIVEPELSWTNSKRVDTTNSSTSKIIAASSAFSVSDYIEIPNSFDTARVEGVQAYKNVNSYPINFYDADKAWIDCSGDVKGEYDFTEIIPSNAKYIVLCQYITAEYPIANVSIAFETNAAFATPEIVENIVEEHIEPIEDEIDVLSESSTKVMITQNDIDSTVSDSHYIVENGNIKTNAQITKGSFMLFKPEITAVEFTIGDLWDTNRFELCLGCGYYNEERVNAGAVLVDSNNYFVLYTVSANNIGDSGTVFAQDARENPIPIVSVGDRCMVEIVLDKYILGWVWNNTQNRWDYWFMLNPTDTWSLCNPVHTRVRYGWNERIGIGLSVIFNSAAADIEMMKDVNILSRKGTNLEIYHNAVRMGRLFSNRKWLAIGDSITAYDGLNGWGYVGYTSRRNMLDTINCGNSGWTMCNIWQKHAGFAPYEEINVDWEDAVAELGANDVVTIFAGTNDFHSVGRTDIETVEPYRYPITLGATDPTDANAKNPRTTLGALRLLIEKLQDTNPSVKIIVFAPFLRTDSDYPINTEGMTMREFSDAICDVAKEYGLEHYNLCDYAGINTISIESLTNDGLHPNQKGGERLGEIMARWIY